VWAAQTFGMAVGNKALMSGGKQMAAHYQVMNTPAYNICSKRIDKIFTI